MVMNKVCFFIVCC